MLTERLEAMTTVRPRTVEVDTSVELISGKETLLLPTRLIYRSTSPYSVQVMFSSNGTIVRWEFDRDLLVNGIDVPVGMGDVRVRPWGDSSADAVALVLSAPDGNALLKVPRIALVDFLERTYEVVPLDHESAYMDTDAAIEQLLAGS